ncbi:hypothetical protein Q5752_005059 [Cryptotrichosporon argae]
MPSHRRASADMVFLGALSFCSLAMLFAGCYVLAVDFAAIAMLTLVKSWDEADAPHVLKQITEPRGPARAP